MILLTTSFQINVLIEDEVIEASGAIKDIISEGWAFQSMTQEPPPATMPSACILKFSFTRTWG